MNPAVSTRPQILIVDDEAALLSMMQRLLSGRYHVVVVPGGESALNVLKSPGCAVRLVLLDLTMPGMDGSILLSRLRAEHPKLPVVVMSGLSEATAEPLLRGEHPDGYLHKPVHVAEITEIVDRLIAPAFACKSG